MTDKIRKQDGFSLLEVMYVMALSIAFYLFVSVVYRDLFEQVDNQSISRDLQMIAQGAALAKRHINPILTTPADVQTYTGVDFSMVSNPLGYPYDLHTDPTTELTIVTTQVRDEVSAQRIAFDIGSNASYVEHISGRWEVRVDAVSYPDLLDFLKQVNHLTVITPYPIEDTIKFSPEQVRIVEGESCGSTLMPQAIGVVTRDTATLGDKYKDIVVADIDDYGRVVTCQDNIWKFPYQTPKCGDYTEIDLVDKDAEITGCSCVSTNDWNPVAYICCPAGTPTYDPVTMTCT